MAVVRLRRPEDDVRIEFMPLIDVIFLLLTFFIYAMVLLVRADLLPLEMQTFVSGTTATPAAAITISIDETGQLFVDREPMALAEVLPRLKKATAADPEMIVYVAAAATGDVDRLPTFLDLYDQLAYAGLDIRLVGAPSDVETE